MVVTFTKMIGIQGNCLYFLWAHIRLHKKSEFEGSFRYSTKQTAAGKQPPPVKWVTAGPFSPIVLLHVTQQISSALAVCYPGCEGRERGTAPCASAPHLQQGDRNLPLIAFAWLQDLSRKGSGADQGGDIFLFCREITF